MSVEKFDYGVVCSGNEKFMSVTIKANDTVLVTINANVDYEDPSWLRCNGEKHSLVRRSCTPEITACTLPLNMGQSTCP
jgi:hypothetical protein